MTDLWDHPLNRRELLRGGAGAAVALGLAGRPRPSPAST
jgi:hypothetical protein